jgi:hypothetical protein
MTVGLSDFPRPPIESRENRHLAVALDAARWIRAADRGIGRRRRISTAAAPASSCSSSRL